MSLFQEAVELNNAGVSALLDGNHESAIDSMTEAIKLMRSELSKMGPVELEHDNDVVRTYCTHTVEIPSMESCDTIVFNGAVKMPTINEDSGSPNQFDMNIFISCVVFNLALVHHFKASSGNMLCMTKAEKLYGMALKLLDSECLHSRTALIVKLACINNLSQIRYSLGDYNNAREGLSQVSDFMRQSSNQTIFEEPQIQGLLMNMLLLKAPKVASAA